MKRIPQDKLSHFRMGFLIALFAMIASSFMWWIADAPVLLIPVFTTITPVVAGLAKELYDMLQPRNRFDAFDMLWTWLGGAVVFVPVWLVVITA